MEEMAVGKTLHDKLKNQSFCLSSIFAGFFQAFSYSLYVATEEREAGTLSPMTPQQSLRLPSTQA